MTTKQCMFLSLSYSLSLQVPRNMESSAELEEQDSYEGVLGFHQQKLNSYQGTSGATGENMAVNFQLLCQDTDSLRILLSILSNEVNHLHSVSKCSSSFLCEAVILETGF